METTIRLEELKGVNRFSWANAKHVYRYELDHLATSAVEGLRKQLRNGGGSYYEVATGDRVVIAEIDGEHINIRVLKPLVDYYIPKE